MGKSPSRIIDISVPIHPGMPVFPGDPGVRFDTALDMACGGPANVTVVTMGSQTGTHFDTPHHILNNGQTTDDLDLTVFYGPVRVFEISPKVQAITAEVLSGFDWSGSPERVLLKTRNSTFWQTDPTAFRTDFAALTPCGGEFIARQGVRLIGVDYLSVELYGSADLGAHKALLTPGVVILEGVNLSEVSPGDYTLSAFPLRYQGLDGAPTRAVLIV